MYACIPTTYCPAMSQEQSNNPLHGLTLETILTRLVDYYGWERLGGRIKIKCFNHEPSIKSSLKFLRTTPWARKQVEDFYILHQKYHQKDRSHD